MRTEGRYHSASLSLDGKLLVTFEVSDKDGFVRGIDKLKDKELTIEAKVSRSGRSLNANAYFWKLCDLIGKSIGSDKDSVYIAQLSSYGVFYDAEVKKDAIQCLRSHFRYTEVLAERKDSSIVRCFFGSSSYDSEEMSHLIDGTVRDAKELGIDTLTPDEQAHLISAWKGGDPSGY